MEHSANKAKCSEVEANSSSWRVVFKISGLGMRLEELNQVQHRARHGDNQNIRKKMR